MTQIDCDCGTKVTLAPHNTMIFTPSDKNFHGAWIDVVCRCGEHNTAGIEQDALEKLVGAGYAITIPFPTLVLEKRFEDEIALLGAVLDKMPDDVLSALFASPPPKSYHRQRWT